MTYVISLLAGSLFGAGLVMSGMTDTAKVQGFLDVFGIWDPTLAFVMGGAMVPMALAWLVARRRPAALNGAPFPGKPEMRIDRRLMGGSALFGIGWGLVGLCPGPALAAFGFGDLGVYVFLAAMCAAMALLPWFERRLDRAVPAE